MQSKFGRRMRAAIVLYMCGSLATAWAADTTQLPRDDSTGPGAAVGNSGAPWKQDVESVRQQIPISISNARTETVTWACGAGYAGARFQTRLVKTFTNGVSQADPWSELQGECVALPSVARGTVLYTMSGNQDSSRFGYRTCQIGGGCWTSMTCPAGVFTPMGYGSYQSGSGEGTAIPVSYIQTALCIQP
ncbi:hypothetical protein LMG3410_01531 [Achromobacter aegrifaciens]|uniref:Secreted protein n=1 Tax=Achromobacter mucicolens TaxID=1389922 RepID=A0ABM8LKY5_9BURK|nr:hypothetical protein MC81_30545 [Achromobacter insolitus]CAB3846233.1 hypothetical protein LMG3410_01531 [Achromobacter aegrifaciens]CAB3913810.1 hypothetical protein LMG3415_05118 [Achromobacter mucicolens]